MSTTTDAKKLTLQSSDKEKFVVEQTAAVQSVTLKNMVDDGCTYDVIPLQNVKSETLAKVVEFLNMHADSGLSEADMKKIDDDFLSDLKWSQLFDLILAANYLDIKGLMDITCQKVADGIMHKQPEEVREIFNIENDFTPYEEKQLRKENAWAFID